MFCTERITEYSRGQWGRVGQHINTAESLQKQKGQDVNAVWQLHVRPGSSVCLCVCDGQAADVSTRLLQHISGDNEARGSSGSTSGWSDCDLLPRRPAVKPVSPVVWLKWNSSLAKVFTTNTFFFGIVSRYDVAKRLVCLASKLKSTKGTKNQKVPFNSSDQLG